MTDRSLASPQTWARLGGLFYLLIIVTGLFGEMAVRNAVVVPGDAAATAARLLASEPLWRIGLAGDLLQHVCDVPLALIFYLLLRPVQRHLALLALFFGLVQTASLVANTLHLMTPLLLLGGTVSTALPPDTQHALIYLSIQLHERGFGIGLIFFACDCLVLGYLIRKSGFLPRVLGVLMQVAGVCYLINSFALILAPKVAGAIFPAILMPSFIAESALCLWLLLKGVDVPAWQARAARAGDA